MKSLYVITFLLLTFHSYAHTLLNSVEDTSKDNNTLRIVQISDTQIGLTLAIEKENNILINSAIGDIDSAYFEMAVETINKLSPEADIVINTGDLVSDPKDETQWNTYLKVSEKLKGPVYEVMGNHDGWSSTGIAEFKSRFKENDYYSFTFKNCLFIVLNSLYLKDPDVNPDEAEKQKKFVTDVLKNDQSRFRIISMHIPVYVVSPDEQDSFNPEQRAWLLDVAQKNKVNIILSGHMHNNLINLYDDSVSLITTGPISVPVGKNNDGTISERGFRVIDIDLSSGKFTHEFIKLDK